MQNVSSNFLGITMNRHLYRNEIFNMALVLDGDDRQRFMTELATAEKNPVVMFGFNAWLGFLGIDRFVIGDILLGFLKLITFGGLGIWVLIDYFLIGNRTRTVNLKKAYAIHTRISGYPPAEPLV